MMGYECGHEFLVGGERRERKKMKERHKQKKRAAALRSIISSF